MTEITDCRSVQIVGVKLRTSNAEAFQTIPPHWQRFTEERIVEQVPNKISNDVYAVYTEFENEGTNNEGTYSLVLGVPVSNLDEIPPGLASATVPASKRAVFPVALGAPEEVGMTVGAKWQEIWARSDLNKTFLADYELYREDGEVAIYVGVD